MDQDNSGLSAGRFVMGFSASMYHVTGFGENGDAYMCTNKME
jgi:hypothetical protein